MIVHVLRRAAGGRARRRSWSRPIREAIAAAVEKAGGRAVMTRADHASGSDRIFEALGSRRSRAAASEIVVNVQGDLPTIAPADIARGARRRSPIPRSISRRSPPRSPSRRSAPIRTWSRWSARRSRPAGCARSISPAPPRPRARGRSITTSGSTPIAAPRWSASSSCRPRRSSSARSSSSCARWRPACASTSPIVDSVPLGVDTPEDLRTARAMLARLTLTRRLRTDRSKRRRHGARKKIVFQGEPGANSHLACHEAYPDYEPVPCPTFEDCLRRGRPAARPTSA